MVERDVLLIARNDHSMKIYDQLAKDGNLRYSFLTYKVFPKFAKKIFRLFFKENKFKRAKFAEHGDVNSCYIITILEYFKYVKHYKWAYNFFKKYNYDVFENMVARKLRKNNYKLIHYWPIYSYKTISKYKLEHPDVITVADLYCPSAVYISREMSDLYERYGIKNPYNDEKVIADDLENLRDAENIFAPSNFVIDTYKDLLNIKNYHIVSYGIFIDKKYKKKERKAFPEQITDFVYCGGSISIEKGCDTLFNFFANHCQYKLHVYGSIKFNQHHIFDRFKVYSNIIFHGFVPSDELQDYIKKFDVGIHLSRFDAYSLSVAKMIGTGLPVILSDKTGNMDDVQKYGFGLVVSCLGNSIEESVLRMTNPDNYNNYVDNIDSYINQHHKTYEERVIDIYKRSLQFGKLTVD